MPSSSSSRTPWSVGTGLDFASSGDGNLVCARRPKATSLLTLTVGGTSALFLGTGDSLGGTEGSLQLKLTEARSESSLTVEVDQSPFPATLPSPSSAAMPTPSLPKSRQLFPAEI